MRDEVIAELIGNKQNMSLHVYCHVSGGFVFGRAKFRNDILHQHMDMVIKAIHYGDKKLIIAHPELENANVWVHFLSNIAKYKQVEGWGLFETFG